MLVEHFDFFQLEDYCFLVDVKMLIPNISVQRIPSYSVSVSSGHCHVALSAVWTTSDRVPAQSHGALL